MTHKSIYILYTRYNIYIENKQTINNDQGLYVYNTLNLNNKFFTYTVKASSPPS